MTTVRAPGRPKDLEKRCAILDAAQALVAERGLDGVAIEAIAARSGVSKVTVYGHFGDKANIFEALVDREVARSDAIVASAAMRGGTFEERLTNLGQALVELIADPCYLAMDRAISIEVSRNPQFGQRFFDAGPGRLHALVTCMMEEQAATGGLAIADPSQAAQDLLSLWFGFHAIERRFLIGATPDADELRDRVRHAVALFLRAYAPA